jgi:hypothetical protein
MVESATPSSAAPEEIETEVEVAEQSTAAPLLVNGSAGVMDPNHYLRSYLNGALISNKFEPTIQSEESLPNILRHCPGGNPSSTIPLYPLPRKSCWDSECS